MITSFATAVKPDYLTLALVEIVANSKRRRLVDHGSQVIQPAKVALVHETPFAFDSPFVQYVTSDEKQNTPIHYI